MTSERIGPYHIDQLLGRGGMGEVYRAYDEKLDRHVAIKLIRTSAVRSETLKHFLREARTAAQLSHPSIVQIYHVEKVAGDDCIVMELVDGQPLSMLIRNGPLEPLQCLALACQIAAGLAEAHAKQIVHRDLKAENVMVTAEGRAKILDFGLAKPLPSASDSRSNELIGTPRSMSPEQANELPVDARSDLFSFGTLLYEVATGTSPFLGRTPLAILHQVCHHQPPLARELNPEVPLELSTLIGHLLEKQPEDRPGSVLEVLRTLERIRASVAEHGDLAWIRPPVLHDESRQMTLLCCSLGSRSEDGRSGDDPVVGDFSMWAPGFASAVAEVVQHHLGSVVRTTPDRLLACFGYPRAGEDDARRAARAALDVLARFRSDLAPRQPGLALRLVLHTGVVETPGSPAASERALRDMAGSGAPWELTSELLRVAESETICVSGATHRLIRGTFDCEGPGELPGFGEPVFRLRGRRERRGVAPSSDLSTFVARREELELLKERWRLTHEGRGQAVLVAGDAGIGKTRLLGAFRARLDLAASDWWSCRSSPQFQNSALRPVIALLWQVLATERGAPLGEHRSRLEDLTARHGVSGHFPLLADLLGLPLDHHEVPSPQSRPKRTLEAVLELLLAMTAERPRVWVVEDLHWSDPSTLELLDQLIDQVPTTRLLLLLSYRPRFRSPWGERTYLTPLVLSGLNTGQVRALIRQRTADNPLPDDLVEQIVELTDGVPLFVEELTRLVVESGLVREVEGPYVGQGGSERLAIPTTLRGALMARLDRLGPTKQVAQLAAVFGREFSRDVLCAVSPFDEQVLRRELDRLVESELLYRQGVSKVRYFFKHALIRKAAYESLAATQRREYHAEIAKALEAEFSDTVRIHPELLAHHFTAAGQAEEAAFFWLRAGRKTWAKVEAIHHLEQALDQVARLPESPRRHRLELDCQSALGPAIMATKGFGAPEVKRAYDRVLELGRMLGEAPDFKTLWGYWRFYSTLGEWHKAQELARQLEDEAQSGGGSTELVVAWRSAGCVLFHTGRPQAAWERLKRGIALEVDGGAGSLPFVHHPTVSCQAYAAWALWQLGRTDRALEVARESIGLARRLGEPGTLALALATGCLIHRLRRESAEVLELAAEQIELARRHQLGLALAGAKLFHGGALASQGSPEEGLAEMLEGLDEWTAARTSASLTFILGDLAQVYLEAGEVDAGLATLDRALAIVEAGGESFYRAELLRLRGEFLMRRGEESAAVDCFTRALDTAAEQGAVILELRAALSLGRLLGPGDEQAARRIVEIRRRITEGLETSDLLAAAASVDDRFLG